MATHRISPSELTFLWSECPRCFYLKVARGFSRPATAFPKIFTRIDRLMTEMFSIEPSSAISKDLPPGKVHTKSHKLTSQPISFPGQPGELVISGLYDALIYFDDGSYGVIDFKTTEVKPEIVAFYSRQLHAYAYALEHPAEGSLALSPVTVLGLLCYEPRSMVRNPQGDFSLTGLGRWIDIPKDEAKFLAFLQPILAVLESPAPPPPGEKCAYCQYRSADET